MYHYIEVTTKESWELLCDILKTWGAVNKGKNLNVCTARKHLHIKVQTRQRKNAVGSNRGCSHTTLTRPKPSGKLRRLMPSFGSILAVRLKKFFLGRKLLFFKIESRNFQVQFEIEFRETSPNFNSFMLFRQ